MIADRYRGYSSKSTLGSKTYYPLQTFYKLVQVYTKPQAINFYLVQQQPATTIQHRNYPPNRPCDTGGASTSASSDLKLTTVVCRMPVWESASASS